MKNLLWLLIGLGILIGLLVVCSVPSVYKSAANCSNEQFAKAGIAATATHLPGSLFAWPKNRLISLTGTLTDGSFKDKALSILNNDCKGAWLNKNVAGLSVAAPVVEPAPVVEAAPVVTVPSPYELTAIVNADRQISLNGYVPNQESMDAIVGTASADYGDTNVTNNLQIIDGAPADWRATAIASIDAIDSLNNGRVEMRDLQVAVYGDAADQLGSDSVQSTINGLVNDPYNTSYLINVPAPAPAAVAADTCQIDFNNLLSADTINFESAQAVIASSSYGLLDQMAAVAANCPEASISIEGHTDSQGPDVYNQDLSERRASAVVDYLCLLYTSPSPRDQRGSRMPSSA